MAQENISDDKNTLNNKSYEREEVNYTERQTASPQFLRDFIGQERATTILKIFIEAACKRNETVGHILLYGESGVGKSTLAHIIANEMNVNIKIVSADVISEPSEMAAILNVLKEGEILLLNNIQCLKSSMIEEMLCIAMTEYAVDIMIGRGSHARSIRLDLPHFTLIGETSQIGKIPMFLRNNFDFELHLERYKEEDLAMIVNRMADSYGVEIEKDGAKDIASHSKGLPRTANKILRRARDFAQINSNGLITYDIVERILQASDFDFTE